MLRNVTIIGSEIRCFGSLMPLGPEALKALDCAGIQVTGLTPKEAATNAAVLDAAMERNKVTRKKR